MARILFVDDDTTTLRMLSRIAEMSGHEPFTAASGQEALETVGTVALDLIFVDMNLADTDGLTLIADFRAIPDVASIPVVVLSAATELDVVEQVKAAGGQAYLPKPISMPTLVEVIREHTAT